MSEILDNRNVNAEVSFLSNDVWQHLGGISTLRETTGAVTKSTAVTSIPIHEISIAFVCAAPYSLFLILVSVQILLQI